MSSLGSCHRCVTAVFQLNILAISDSIESLDESSISRWSLEALEDDVEISLLEVETLESYVRNLEYENGCTPRIISGSRLDHSHLTMHWNVEDTVK